MQSRQSYFMSQIRHDLLSIKSTKAKFSCHIYEITVVRAHDYERLFVQLR